MQTQPRLHSNITQAQRVLRQLTMVWADFESRLLKVPIVARAMQQQLRLADYLTLISDHYQQVVEGSGWISRAASSITAPYLDQRSVFIRHAATEHLDYQMLEKSYLASGGQLAELMGARKNIGSEALSAWMYQRASQPNPFDLLGAMFIIEGLGKRFAQTFANAMDENPFITDPDQLAFYRYHAAHDEDHLQELEDLLSSSILDITGMDEAIVRTAKVTARLYLLQLEELGHY